MQKQPPYRFGRHSAGPMIQAVIAYIVLYAFGVQGMQAASRGIEIHHLATAATVLFVRFMGVALVGVLAGVAWTAVQRDRSWSVFRPGNLPMRLTQGAAQALQTVFIVLAAAELAGKFQAAVSLAIVGLWSNAIGFVLNRLDKHEPAKHKPVRARAWLYPVLYVGVAVFIAMQSGASQGNLWLGLLFMAMSGLCTAGLHPIAGESTDDEAGQPSLLAKTITSTIWQNCPAALLSIGLLFVAVPRVGQASVPTEHVGTTLWVLALVALCSLAQQLGLLLAAWSGQKIGMTTERLVPLRGAQVFFGALLDSLFFSNPPHGAVQWTAMVLVLVPMTLGWIWTRPKPQQG